MRSVILLILLVLVGGYKVYANGGPYDGSGSVGSGNIVFLQESDIQLRSERLTIIPVGDWVEVHAVYVLENTGPARDVEYAFPVESSQCGLSNLYRALSREPELKLLDGAMPLQLQIHPLSDVVDAPDNCYFIDSCFVNWYTTTLSFGAGETKTLSAHCRIMTSFIDFSNNKRYFVSCSSRYFQYRLEPASYWGCGTADTLELAIDFSWLLENRGEIDSLDAPGEWLSESVYGLTATDYSLNSAPMIKIEYSIDRWKLAELIENYALDFWQLEEISVSSELPDNDDYDYDKWNLFGGNRTSAWAEGAPGDGTGEWIEIDLPENFDLGCIGIINGYQRSRETYEANGRVAQVLCTITFADGEVYEKVIDIVKDSEDLSWDSIATDPCSGFDIIWTSGFHGSPYRVTESVRLEILSTYPGNIYNDLCISELVILGFPHGMWDW